MIRTRSLLAVGCLVIATGAYAQNDPNDIVPSPILVRAQATIAGCTDPTISGQAVLIERPSSEGVKLVDVALVVRGLPAGKHAVHIHEVGSCTPCAAAGGHFDPGPAGLSNPDGNHPFHMGDLVNLEVGANGIGAMHATTSRVTLSPGPLSVFDANGSAFIVHVGADTYCPDGPTAGCAGGARAACGVIQKLP
jgi:Cu-Zn family superoxide dismutase